MKYSTLSELAASGIGGHAAVHSYVLQFKT